MAKEKDDGKVFFNVVDLSKIFASEPVDPEWDQAKFNKYYMLWVLRIQLGMLQQLTMISQHCEKFSKAMTDLSAEVERVSGKNE
jgi:hypothetical protein